MTATRSRKKATDMTAGSIVRLLISFSLPLLIGNIFQQLYNTVDSVVVGQFVGKEALAAVGSTGPIINTLIGFFLGLSAGAGVVISQYFGAHDEASVRRAVHTSMVLTFWMSILFSVLGVLMVPFMLRMMSTPEDVLPGATLYLRIYFAGCSGLLFYNTGSGILRAVGDSRRPLYFLIFSAVTNTILDVVFVTVFKMGIAGVAVATIVAQFLSALLTLWVMFRSDECYRLSWKEMKVDRTLLRQIWHMGIPTAIQSAVTSFSNVFVQGYINVFGSDCMAGWSSYSKIDQFIGLPQQSIGIACTTFVGQNLGAHQPERAKKGTHTALAISIGCTAVLMVPVMIFAEALIMLFSKEAAVITCGALFIRVLSPFYIICAIHNVYSNTLRGCGETRAPMVIMLGSFVLFRQIYLFIISKVVKSMIWVGMGYPFGWILASALTLAYYRFSNWEERALARAPAIHKEED